MNLKNKPPVFVPVDCQPELERLSKAALMDMVWDYAAQASGSPGDPAAAMEEFRKRREVILVYRQAHQQQAAE